MIVIILMKISQPPGAPSPKKCNTTERRSVSRRRRWNNAGKDVVVLHIPPRGFFCPSLSPFVVKLETYVRMAEIPHVVSIVSICNFRFIFFFLFVIQCLVWSGSVVRKLFISFFSFSLFYLFCCSLFLFYFIVVDIDGVIVPILIV